MSRFPVRRKCCCCSKFFVPDPRTADRQKYCSQPDCRRVSKAASQGRWLSRNGNGDAFRGPDQVQRVQEWRRRHPGYWKRQKATSQRTQPAEDQPTNPEQSSCNATREERVALQEDWRAQDPAFVGLISMVTGSTLQEDIAATTRQLLLRGRNILGCVFPGHLSRTDASSHDP